MFDIGFAELVIIAVVALLVIGPERLPSAIRTASLWLNRIKRGFTDIKREVEQELHNDAVMQELRRTGEELKSETDSIGNKIKGATEDLKSGADSIGNDMKEAAEPIKASLLNDTKAADGKDKNESGND